VVLSFDSGVILKMQYQEDGKKNYYYDDEKGWWYYDRVCVPEKTPSKQVRVVYEDWLKETTEHLGDDIYGYERCFIH